MIRSSANLPLPNFLYIGFLLGWLTFVSGISAQDADPSATATPIPRPEVSRENVAERIERAQSNTALEEEVRTTVVDLYTQALDKVTEAEQWRQRAREFEEAREATPELLVAIEAEREALQETALPDPSDYESLALLESRFIELESRLSREREELASLEGEFQRRTDRRIAVPGLRAAARERLDDLQRQLASTETWGDAPELAAARLTLLLARQRAAEDEIDAYDSELLSYEARGELLPARRDLAALKVARSEEAVHRFREVVNIQRRAEAEEATRQAREAASRVHPVAGEIAVENEALARLRSGPGGLAAKIEEVSGQLESTGQVLGEVRSEFESVRSTVEAIGLSDAIGYLLRSKRADLPSLSQYRRRNDARQSEIRAVQFSQIQTAEERSNLTDQVEERIESILADLDPQISQRRRTDIRLTLQSLLRTQQTLLDSLLRDYDRYFTQLIDLDAKEKQLIETTEDFEAYIDERILWVPSGDRFGPRAVRDSIEALAWLIRPENWIATGRTIGNVGHSRWLSLVGGLLIVVLLFGSRPLLAARLKQEGKVAAKGSTQSIGPTLRAALYTLLMVIMRPAILAWGAWLLSSPPDAPELATAVASGLWAIALLDLMFELVRTVCIEQGLGESHFSWPPRAVAMVRRTLRRLSWVAHPLVFLYVGLQSQSNDAWRESLGRIALIGIVVVLAFAMFWLLRPRHGAFMEYLRTHPESWATRLQRIWYPLAVVLPSALAVIAIWGYTYTAYHLALRLYGTGWLLIGLLIVGAGGRRWLLLTRRRLLVEQARKKREAAMAELRAQKESAPAVSETVPSVMEAEPDYASLDSQVRQMLNVGLAIGLILGLWWVWVDVLPALNMLRRIELWHIAAPAGELTAATGELASGETFAPAGEQLVPITLADLALGLILLGLTIIGVRNIPGFLEITFLQRLNLENSIRFAITSLSRYILIVMGSIAVFGAVGIGWDKVQWLIAAMTVGLGFGLQEIFANFVSGLIILFERPIRIGDIVTVGEVTGNVTQIRMRATTITDWDRKEFIVPNKEFITSNLMNWTLSNSITRVNIPVGVAYGSDTARAREIMLSLAQACEKVLEDPPPFTVFKSFGDNALDLAIYVYIPSREVYWEVLNELTTGIDREFKEAGIEIAFPQRDIHFDSDRPLRIQMENPDRPGTRLPQPPHEPSGGP